MGICRPVSLMVERHLRPEAVEARTIFYQRHLQLFLRIAAGEVCRLAPTLGPKETSRLNRLTIVYVFEGEAMMTSSSLARLS